MADSLYLKHLYKIYGLWCAKHLLSLWESGMWVLGRQKVPMGTESPVRFLVWKLIRAPSRAL